MSSADGDDYSDDDDFDDSENKLGDKKEVLKSAQTMSSKAAKNAVSTLQDDALGIDDEVHSN